MGGGCHGATAGRLHVRYLRRRLDVGILFGRGELLEEGDVLVRAVARDVERDARVDALDAHRDRLGWEVRDQQVEGLVELLRQPGQHANEQLDLVAGVDVALQRQRLVKQRLVCRALFSALGRPARGFEGQ